MNISSESLSQSVLALCFKFDREHKKNKKTMISLYEIFHSYFTVLNLKTSICTGIYHWPDELDDVLEHNITQQQDFELEALTKVAYISFVINITDSGYEQK